MSFRTVVIKNRAKLDFSLNYLVCRSDTIKKIHISEISILIIESTAVSITSALLNELIKNNIKVIFCDEKHLPQSQLVGFYGNYHTSQNILKQVNWQYDLKQYVWTDIIRNKIANQAKLLRKYKLQDKLLLQYLDQLQLGDSTNREGHSAKVYFNILFDQLNRRVPSFYNSALNYGYAILLSMFAREIVASGYITQLGIWHCNQFNYYNLASDMMETYRVIVDDMVMTLEDNDEHYKMKMANIVNTQVMIGGKKVYLDNAIHIYVTSLFNTLNGEQNMIINYTDYELPIYENTSDV